MAAGSHPAAGAPPTGRDPAAAPAGDHWRAGAPSRPRLVSLFGPAGAGKSFLAKALVAALGDQVAARVPGDYFLLPGGPRLTPPYQCDWPLLLASLAAPVGSVVRTPRFDFTTFTRTPSADSQGDQRTFTIRPVLLIDTLYPSPSADAWLLITADAATRRARIAARDAGWHARVQDRWESLAAAHAALLATAPAPTLTLDGGAPLAANVATILATLGLAASGGVRAPSSEGVRK